MSRDRILADVRRALARPATPPVPHPHPVWPRAVRPHWNDLAGQFRSRFEGLGGHWHEAAAPGIAEVAAAILGSAGSTVLVARDADGDLDRLAVAERLAARGLTVVRTVEAGGADRIGLTITATTAAIAESGTFGLLAEPGQGRLASVIGPVHLTVLRPGRLVGTLGEFLVTAGAALAGGRSSAAILITGPSRTADIEGELIVGVHGPKAVHCVLVGEG